MKILIFVSVAFGNLVDKPTNTRSYNPECPTENAAINCENDCITANVECVQRCNGNQGSSSIINPINRVVQTYFVLYLSS